MGAWGTAPLENDGALDFLGELGRARKEKRIERVREALDKYRDFDRRLRAGTNVTVASAEDLAELLASREDTLECNAHDLPQLFELMPEYATAEAWAAHVGAMAEPHVDDGGTEAQRAIAAAWAIAARLGAIDGGRQAHHLQVASEQDVQALAAPAREVLAAIARNPLLRAGWHEHAQAWAAALDDLGDALGRV
jgi:hypothetical protein